jgi:hypothetical protein
MTRRSFKPPEPGFDRIVPLVDLPIEWRAACGGQAHRIPALPFRYEYRLERKPPGDARMDEETYLFWIMPGDSEPADHTGWLRNT